ncbi:MAG: cell wall hydrolase [Lachnospiraceae bacterium]|nr:cell wall hydrolase [Lachnospiraceae bacterium]
MSSMLSRTLMVMRSLSLKTHTFTLCVVAGTLLLCMGFFKEPNIDVSHTTTSIQKEMENASASNLTICIEVASLSVNSDYKNEVLEINELTLDDKKESEDEGVNVSFEDYLEFARLIEAEASTEDIIGKTYVADVVINRVVSDIFPDSISEVINDPGQFDPVNNKYIKYAIPTHESKEAVMNALNDSKGAKGALYFQKSKATEWGDKEYLFRYGNHSFYR